MGEIDTNQLPGFVYKMLFDLQSKGKQASTIKRYQYNLQHFFQWLKEESGSISFNTWKNLTNEEYMGYYEFLTIEKDYSDRTLNHIFAAIKKLALFYLEEGHEVYVPDDELRMIRKQGLELKEHDFLTDIELDKLMNSIESYHDLSEDKAKNRPLIYLRNQSMVSMMVNEGLSLQEMADLKMFNLSFMRNVIEIGKTPYKIERTINMSPATKKLYLSYLSAIPKPVRPRQKTHYPETQDPFFVAFDYYRSTYRWVYEIDQPKNLTARTIQHTIQEEAKRAELGKRVTARTLRNTCVLKLIKDGKSKTEMEKWFGFDSPYSLNRYLRYAEKENLIQKV